MAEVLYTVALLLVLVVLAAAGIWAAARSAGACRRHRRAHSPRS